MNRANFTGEQIGPYYVRERVGQGGMADVYRAYQPSVKREVALKVIPILLSSEYQQMQTRFKQEAEMIASLEHPHILPIFDYGIDNEVLYLAMRLLRGGTLRDRLLGGAVPIDTAADLFAQVASALGYAHRRGIIHRDLKPSRPPARLRQSLRTSHDRAHAPDAAGRPDRGTVPGGPAAAGGCASHADGPALAGGGKRASGPD